MFSFFENLSLMHRKTLARVIIAKKIEAQGFEDHLMLKRPLKKFGTFGLCKKKAIFHLQNKAYFPLFCVGFYVIKEIVHDLAWSIELWMRLGIW